MVQIKSVSVALALVAAANAHIAAWGKGEFVIDTVRSHPIALHSLASRCQSLSARRIAAVVTKTLDVLLCCSTCDLFVLAFHSPSLIRCAAAAGSVDGNMLLAHHRIRVWTRPSCTHSLSTCGAVRCKRLVWDRCCALAAYCDLSVVLSRSRPRCATLRLELCTLVQHVTACCALLHFHYCSIVLLCVLRPRFRRPFTTNSLFTDAGSL